MRKFLRDLRSFIQIAGGLFGFALSILFVYFEFGGGAVIAALFIFPVTFALLPLYSLFVYGTWNLLLINYGSIAAGVFLHWMAAKIEQRPAAPQIDPVVIAPPPQTRVGEPAPTPKTDDRPQTGSSLTVIALFSGLDLQRAEQCGFGCRGAGRGRAGTGRQA